MSMKTPLDQLINTHFKDTQEEKVLFFFYLFFFLATERKTFDKYKEHYCNLSTPNHGAGLSLRWTLSFKSPSIDLEHT